MHLSRLQGEHSYTQMTVKIVVDENEKFSELIAFIKQGQDVELIQGEESAVRIADASRLEEVENHVLTLSHEFRTPINIIVGYSSLLRNDDASLTAENKDKAVEAMYIHASTLLDYVNEMVFTLASR